MLQAKYCLIGYPVKHSLSPAMHNAAFAYHGVEAEYTLREVPPEELDRFLSEAAGRYSGLNVTIPHKFAAKSYIEKHGTIDANAARLGAVNTIKSDSGKLCGYNTDGPGFYRSLVTDLGCEPEGKTVFVLGAGGAASAVVMYLGNGPKKILVADTDTGRVDKLIRHFSGFYDSKRIESVEMTRIGQAISGAGLFINATPIGMKEGDPSPIDTGALARGTYVYDLVYNRPKTALVKEALRAKLHAVTGLGMLLHQGAIAFEIWTGLEAPLSVMKAALLGALKKAA